MDRFIASAQYKETNGDVILKSNMDRFIVDYTNLLNQQLTDFKIQYG